MSAHGRTDVRSAEGGAVNAPARLKGESPGAQRESSPLSAVRIIGLGSPFGDDRAGWEAVAHLATAELPPGIDVHACSSPATDLLPALRGARRVVLVDAIAAGKPGKILRCDRTALRRYRRSLSSHGVDLNTVLDLAEALGELPADVALVGVSIDPAHTGAAGTLSGPVAAALPRLARAVLDEATR